jgi:hypothetical protein
MRLDFKLSKDFEGKLGGGAKIIFVVEFGFGLKNFGEG